MDLYEHRRKKVQELSKGMQQKAQLIAALLHEPDLIVVDEPFAGLDPVNTRLIKDIITEQAQRRADGHHVHPPDVPGGGALPPHRAHRPWAERALRTGEPDQARLRRQRGAWWRPRETSPGFRRCSRPGRRTAAGGSRWRPGADPQQVLRAMLARPGVKVERFELAEPSLDDIFVTVVTGDAGSATRGRRPGHRNERRCISSGSSRAGSTSPTSAGAASCW